MAEECNSCFSSSTESLLYHCTYPNCPHVNRLYCIACADIVHRNIIDHKFNQPINQHKSSIQSNKTDIKDKDEKINTTPNDTSLINNFSSLIPSTDNIRKCADAAVTISASQNPVYAIGSVGLQVARVTHSYLTDEIMDDDGKRDKEEYFRLLGKSSCMPISASVCGLAAKAIFLSTGFGWVAAIGYGILGSILSQKAFEKFLPESKQRRRELKITALRTFQFFPQDLENKDIFNRKNIGKRYKKLAKKYHPDMKYGSAEKFNELEVYHRICLSMLDDDTVFPMYKFDENVAQPKSIEYTGNGYGSNEYGSNDTSCIVM
eukprot:282757_1